MQFTQNDNGAAGEFTRERREITNDHIKGL